MVPRPHKDILQELYWNPVRLLQDSFDSLVRKRLWLLHILQESWIGIHCASFRDLEDVAETVTCLWCHRGTDPHSKYPTQCAFETFVLMIGWSQSKLCSPAARAKIPSLVFRVIIVSKAWKLPEQENAQAPKTMDGLAQPWLITFCQDATWREGRGGLVFKSTTSWVQSTSSFTLQMASWHVSYLESVAFHQIAGQDTTCCEGGAGAVFQFHLFLYYRWHPALLVDLDCQLAAFHAMSQLKKAVDLPGQESLRWSYMAAQNLKRHLPQPVALHSLSFGQSQLTFEQPLNGILSRCIPWRTPVSSGLRSAGSHFFGSVPRRWAFWSSVDTTSSNTSS